MVVFAGQSDARRSMALLWRGPDRPTGPGLTVDAVVEAAIAVADEQGMAGLSMRAVGTRLGRTAMALYTHVRDKAELLDLMYDHCMGELPTSYDTGDGWRPAVTAWANDLWAFYLRHPWLLQVSMARPVLGPNEFAVLEALVAALAGTGIPARPLRRTVGALFHFVRGAAQSIAETRLAPTATGTTDDEWWLARSAVLAEVAPDFTERFPALSLMDEQGAHQMEDESVPYLEQEAREMFTAGLGVLLDGIATSVGHTQNASD